MTLTGVEVADRLVLPSTSSHILPPLFFLFQAGAPRRGPAGDHMSDVHLWSCCSLSSPSTLLLLLTLTPRFPHFPAVFPHQRWKTESRNSGAPSNREQKSPAPHCEDSSSSSGSRTVSSTEKIHQGDWTRNDTN